MLDNHTGKLRDNSYDKEQYYDEWYDQTESELEEVFKEYDKLPPFSIPKTKEEADRLSEALNILSGDENNMDVMKEIAHVLTEFYLHKKSTN